MVAGCGKSSVMGVVHRLRFGFELGVFWNFEGFTFCAMFYFGIIKMGIWQYAK